MTNRDIDVRNLLLQNSDFIKTVLMLCVILCHSCSFWNGSWFSAITPVFQNEYIGYFANWLGTFHVYGFTVISGFIYSYIRENGGYSDMKVFVVKKINRLLLPYITVSILWVIPFSLLFYHNSVIDIVDDFLLGCGPSQLWFLLMLFGVFLVYRLIEPFICNYRFCSALLLIVAFFIGYIGQVVCKNYFQIFTVLYYLLFFYIGGSLYKYCRVLKKIQYRHLIVIAIVQVFVYVVSVYCGFRVESHFRVVSKLLYMFSTVIGAVSYVLILAVIGNKCRCKGGVYLLMRKNNFFMYLLHQQLIYVTIYLLNGRIGPEVNSMVNFVVAICVSLMLSVGLHKSYLLSRILGETKNKMDGKS